MSEHDEKLNHVQNLLAELRQMDDAGVFQRTPVDTSALVQAEPVERGPRRLHRLFVALQAAACIGLVVGVASFWQAGRGSSGLSEVGNGNASEWAASPCGQAAALVRCFGGSTGDVSGVDCKCVDFDEDGDVDLADYGTFQRTFLQ